MVKHNDTEGNTSATDILDRELDQLVVRFEGFRQQKQEIAAAVRRLLLKGHDLLEKLGEEYDTAERSNRRRGGRPKGYKMSPETRAKLRAAWKRRKAAAKQA